MLALHLNLKNRAPTQFTDYPFNSFCNFKGRQLAAGPSGLFTIGGDDDNGSDVEAFVETVLSNWGTQNVKRPRFCYLSFMGGPLTFSVIDGELEEKSTIDLSPEDGDLPEVEQFHVPRTVAQRFWKFKIANKDGARFSIDGLSVFFVVRPSGLSRNT
jgi:hypothetical protein